MPLVSSRDQARERLKELSWFNYSRIVFCFSDEIKGWALREVVLIVVQIFLGRKKGVGFYLSGWLSNFWKGRCCRLSKGIAHKPTVSTPIINWCCCSEDRCSHCSGEESWPSEMSSAMMIWIMMKACFAHQPLNFSAGDKDDWFDFRTKVKAPLPLIPDSREARARQKRPCFVIYQMIKILIINVLVGDGNAN